MHDIRNKIIKLKNDEAFNAIYKRKLTASVAENKKAKRSFESKLARNIKSDSKSFYAYTNAKKKTSRKVGPLKDTGDRIIEDSKTTASVLNEYFSSVFVEEDLTNIPIPVKIYMGEQDTMLNDVELNSTKILDKISRTGRHSWKATIRV